jgi:hypothetical protein
MTEEDGGKTRVRVHQLVKSLQGDVLSDSEVLHVFTVNSGLIAAMDLRNEADSIAGPSAAFAHRILTGYPVWKNKTDEWRNPRGYVFVKSNSLNYLY